MVSGCLGTTFSASPNYVRECSGIFEALWQVFPSILVLGYDDDHHIITIFQPMTKLSIHKILNGDIQNFFTLDQFHYTPLPLTYLRLTERSTYGNGYLPFMCEGLDGFPACLMPRNDEANLPKMNQCALLRKLCL